MGEVAEVIFGSFELSETDANKHDTVTTSFKEQFIKRQNPIFEQDLTSGLSNTEKAFIYSLPLFIPSRIFEITALYENKRSVTN